MSVIYKISFDKQWFYTMIFDGTDKTMTKKQVKDIDNLTETIKRTLKVFNLKGD
jgi:hypothetical protein